MALCADRARHRCRLPRQADQAGDTAVATLRTGNAAMSSIPTAAAAAPVTTTPAVAAAITACVAAGIAKPVRTAVERRICEIAAAIRGATAVLAQRFAVRLVDESVCDIELAVERKQQRQPRRTDRIDVLVFAAIPPDTAQALVALAVLGEDDGRGVVEETAERAAAERVVVAGVQDEFVPEIVGDLRGHRDVALAAHQIGEEELPQAPRDQRAVLALKARVVLLQPLEQAARPAKGADEFGPPQRAPLAVQPGAGEQGDAEQDGHRYGHDAVDTVLQSAARPASEILQARIQRQSEQRHRAQQEA